MPENIDAFNATAAEVLATLYEVFPAGAEFMGALDYGPGAERSPGRRWDGTIRFLEREGFVHVGREGGIDGAYRFADVTLTAKGLKVLNSVPDVMVADSPTLGQRLTTAVRAGGVEGMKAAIGQVVAFGATAIMNYR